MNKYKIRAVELVTYEREIEAPSIESIWEDINNWEYGKYEMNHTHAINYELQDIEVKEVN